MLKIIRIETPSKISIIVLENEEVERKWHFRYTFDDKLYINSSFIDPSKLKQHNSQEISSTFQLLQKYYGE